MAKGTAAGLLSAGAAATAIGGAYKFGEFLHRAHRLHDVGPSNAVYVRVLQRVRADLDEVKRLLTVAEVKHALEANPPKAKWVYGAMRDVRGALENMAPHTERVAGDVERGSRVGLRHRLHWLLSEKEKLENREKEVTAAHASLTEVIGFLTALEPTDVADNTSIDVDFRREAPEAVDEREVWVDRRDPRHEEKYYEERRYAASPGRVEERDLHIQRDPREPGHIEAQYYERGPGYYDEKRYEERRFDGNLPRRPESFEDRVPERETFMQSEARDPSGAAEYRRTFRGDPGFGDQLLLNPQPVPPLPQPSSREFEREIWNEEKMDFGVDQYGNKLPEPLQRTRYPQYPPRRQF